MLTRFQLAQSLFQYNPETTPLRTIEAARQELEMAHRHLDHLRSQIDTLEDEALYEVEGDGYFVRKLKIAKRTEKTIVLAPLFDGDRKRTLPRQPLEVGVCVTHGSGCSQSEYALGTTTRRLLEELLREAEARVEDRMREVQHLQVQLAMGGLVLTPFQERTLERMFMAINPRRGEEVQPTGINWKEEGF